jgi:undecaprenyl diphosphate synthase
LSEHGKLPRHVAIIMDGNGRWAKQRQLPRVAGHRAGVEAVRDTVTVCGQLGIEVLTLFAFSSENWRRPKHEVRLLMELFVTSLQQEVGKLNQRNVRLRIVGDVEPLPARLQQQIAAAQAATRCNTGLTLVIAANYGGRWDVANAAKMIAEQFHAGAIAAEDIDEDLMARYLSLHDLPEPDLFIRTGGEQRISNFLLWQLAYTELYFTECLWPDFDAQQFNLALEAYRGRQRRFGKTPEQIMQAQGA